MSHLNRENYGLAVRKVACRSSLVSPSREPKAN